MHPDLEAIVMSFLVDEQEVECAELDFTFYEEPDKNQTLITYYFNQNSS